MMPILCSKLSCFSRSCPHGGQGPSHHHHALAWWDGCSYQHGGMAVATSMWDVGVDDFHVKNVLCYQLP